MAIRSPQTKQGQQRDDHTLYPSLATSADFANNRSAPATSAQSNQTFDGFLPVTVGQANEQQHNRLQSRRQSNSAHKRKGWHAVQHNPADDLSGTGRLGNNPAAVYVRPDHSINSKISLDDSPSFPSLGNFAAALPHQQGQDATNRNKASHHKAWTPPMQKQAAQQASTNASPARPKYSDAALPARPKQDAGSSKAMALSDAELTDLTMLLSTHPWAEPGLARAVLAAVNHQLPAADLLLREMEQHQAPSGSDSDEDSANHILPTLQGQDKRDLQDWLAPSEAQSSPQTAKAPAPPTNGSSARHTIGVTGDKVAQVGTEGSQDDDSAVEDLYYKHRREALKLSKAWHKKLHQAANAFAASHHSEGKNLATEAHRTRLRALAAHAEAAEKIERANNAGRGLGQYELDLHGLHATEAIDALDRRLLKLGQLQHHSQAAKLRVIVGRGNNSSGGEASLPRVIESHLLQRNMNYLTGQGVITVYLRGLRH